MADIRVEKADLSEYSKFLSENPPGNPYSLPPLLEAYSRAFSRDFQCIHIVKNDTTIASCALFTASRLGQKTVKLMPLRAYDGVHFRSLGDSKAQKQEYDRLMSLQALEEFLRREYGFYQMVFQPGFMDVRAFQWAGAGIMPQYTYVVDLQTFSEENYTKSLREVLRSAERAGLTTGKCAADELVSLNVLSYERHGRRPPVPMDLLTHLLASVEKTGMLDVTCVRNRDGVIIAGMASLKTPRGLFFYLSGTDARAEKGASHLLYHELLSSGRVNGLSFVDFVGANTPTINLFKSSFGPRLETNFRVWRANSLVTRLASLVKKI